MWQESEFFSSRQFKDLGLHLRKAVLYITAPSYPARKVLAKDFAFSQQLSHNRLFFLLF
ncbi:hypothetical protein SRA_06956 [Streptococcus ratti FA-1 = DSM 20564]|uniref:Transposase n=1 Tax=Streptococcus ratti FA-1 = DSM 20564 TaxID=699248 RepID=A0ABN0GVF2_STRRT|nr:hypothetical protein SRA_06956 [Streptococcus ratti FA-1 = DSM 20564]